MSVLRLSIASLVCLARPSVGLARPPLAAALAPAGDEQLSERGKLRKAKKLYVEAEELAAEGEWSQAADLYEQAYYLVPAKHGFAYKVAIAAYAAGDCDRAQAYLIHFLSYGDRDRHRDQLDEAQRMLEEIDESGCASDKSDMKVDAAGNPVDNEDPFATSTPEDSDDAAKSDTGLLFGGAVLLTLGVGGLSVGGAAAGLAGGTSDELEGLGGESPDGVTGYAAGYYSCKTTTAPCPPDLEDQFEGEKRIAIAGFAVGAILIASGAALVAVHVIKRKRANTRAQLSGIAPTFIPGGAALTAQLKF
ncbi:hypothetical protein ENSA5_38030 [Enhygromyxa salina]|uniref:Tetratricopeptide repeat protein n=1 Tax=Enhygromyxa salina TaxID=215803 RepID=A0A2S9XSF2_9BACT|nr:hypothetical protein [Enhygromyxa salina]PRP95670.1 hypothetical protein ENSA5_38030 [Enhygromyxa salina]